MFEVIPALDLSGGRVVRLVRGERERELVYGEDPLVPAAGFHAAGARWLHVVDLDAAFGDGANRDAVRRLLAGSPLRVQVAGGARSVRRYAELREAGAARVVFGTVAVEEPAVVEEAIRLDPGGVAVALDVRAGRLRTRGWVGEAEVSPEEAARRWGESGAAAIIHTEVERDGTLGGPDARGALRVAAWSGRPTILAGGIGELAHLEGLAGLAGVIVGRALYERRFTLAEALEAARRESSAATREAATREAATPRSSSSTSRS